MNFIIRIIVFGLLLRIVNMVIGLTLTHFGIENMIVARIIWFVIIMYLLYYFIKPYANKYLQKGIVSGICMMIISLLMQYFVIWNNARSQPFVNYQYEVRDFISQQGYIFLIIPFLTVFIGFVLNKYCSRKRIK